MFEYRKWIIRLTNVGYVLGCSVLYVIALWIIFFALVTAVIDISHGTYRVYELLDDVSLLVFSIAVLDVAKYLMLEEVLRKKEDRHPDELKNSLTKFVSIVVTALFLKGLVLAIDVSKHDITNLLYPIALLLTPVVLIIGLGIYHRLHLIQPVKSRAKRKK
ncbi:MAG: hypothetical protein K9M07_07360 [Simkaniaceae bacterium]|nr:hypothetical protein [Simkaniaceae bacterium]MCF7853039.1 hypothetical protein [Simkaniaceae bacterium]